MLGIQEIRWNRKKMQHRNVVGGKFLATRFFGLIRINRASPDFRRICWEIKKFAGTKKNAQSEFPEREIPGNINNQKQQNGHFEIRW